MSEANKTDIDQAFDELAEVCSTSHGVRKQMIDMLVGQIDKCKISEYDKGMMIQSKMTVLKTLDDLLKSDVDTSMRKLKMKLARKDSETNGLVGQTIANLLKSIHPKMKLGDEAPPVDRNAAIKELKEKQANDKNLTLLEGETEACGSTPSVEGEASTVKPVETKPEDDEDEE